MIEKIKNSELSSEQRDTEALLKNLLGQAMADRYVDACRLSAGAFELRVSAPLAAHVIREFESTLRAILKVPMDAVYKKSEIDSVRLAKCADFFEENGFDKDAINRAIRALEPRYTHREEICKIVARLDLDVEGDIAKAWIGLDAASMAHKRSFTKILAVDNDFLSNFFQPFETVVRGIAVKLQHKYASLVRRVDEIVVMENKIDATKKYAAEIPGALPLQRHFFSNLKSSTWLPPLMEHKQNLLGQPMTAFEDGANTRLHMSEWPAGDYLLRMANEPGAETHNLVIDVLKKLSGSNHSDIQRMGIEILAALPPEEAGAHVELAISWLTRDTNNLYAHRAVKLVVAWAQGNQHEAALKFARALLQIWNHDGDIANLFWNHMYEHHLPEIRKALAENCGEAALDLFLDLLEQASAIGRWGQYTHHSRQPFIEQTIPVDGVYGALACAVAITAKEIVEKEERLMEKVVTQIAKRPSKIFTRIAMHILAKNPSAATKQADFYLTTPNFLGENWCMTEYAELANAWFPSLESNQQLAILDAVQAIPSTHKELWKARFEEQYSRPPTPKDEKDFDDSYFRDLVWGWQNVLPPTLQDRVRAIESELGDPDAWKSRFITPEVSPLDANDFASRPFADIAAFLKTWHPGEGSQRQTITALAQGLRRAVAAAPAKFAESVHQLIGSRPIYLRRVFEGLYDATVSGQKNFSWEKILKVIDYALDQIHASTMSELIVEGDDKDYRWACLAAGKLLTRGLSLEYIDSHCTAEIQALVLKFRMLAPDTPEQEDFEICYERDPFFAARDTLRGIAVELCVLTIFWLDKNSAAKNGADNRSALKNLPDLQQLMENELADKSATGRIPRVILGGYLASLNYFDGKWLISQIGNLLPINNEMLRDAIWAGHLECDSQPIPCLMKYLHTSYMKEIASLGLKSNDRQTQLENRLGEFLMNLHLRGFLPTNILNAFWEMASERLLKHCMWILSNHLKASPDHMSDEMRTRGYNYWLARLSAAKAASNPDEFRSEIGDFDQWCYGTTGAEWLLEQLCEMLASGFAPNQSYRVIEWLAKISLNFPDKVVGVLLALLSNRHTDQWPYLMDDVPIRAILRRGLAEGASETKNHVEQIVSILSSNGETKYIDISCMSEI